MIVETEKILHLLFCFVFFFFDYSSSFLFSPLLGFLITSSFSLCFCSGFRGLTVCVCACVHVCACVRFRIFPFPSMWWTYCRCRLPSLPPLPPASPPPPPPPSPLDHSLSVFSSSFVDWFFGLFSFLGSSFLPLTLRRHYCCCSSDPAHLSPTRPPITVDGSDRLALSFSVIFFSFLRHGSVGFCIVTPGFLS